MVEIKRAQAQARDDGDGDQLSASAVEESKYRLLYSKSKVYVYPTAVPRDHIPGFVALVKREAVNPVYLLAWIPESLLCEKGAGEWDKFVKIEERTNLDDEDEDAVLIDLPAPRPESYAFSVPLTSIYSLLMEPLAINLINSSTLPTLYFHDDESLSMTLPTRRSKRESSSSYPPTATSSNSRLPISWGGEDLLSRLKSYAHILRSTLEPSLYLVDPSKVDIDTHTRQIFDDDAIDDILARSSYANSHSPVPAHRRPRPLFSPATSTSNPYSTRSSCATSFALSTFSIDNAELRRKQGWPSSNRFSNITRATRHAAQNILSHPYAKPILPHLPDPVKSLWGSWVEKGGVGEFESARVYLARWARIVAEEGDRARRREAQALSASSGNLEEEPSPLGVFELLQSTINLPTPKTSREPWNPVDERTWEEWFDAGREEMQREVFRRGIVPVGSLRKRIWPFLLGVHAWDTNHKERVVTLGSKEVRRLSSLIVAVLTSRRRKRYHDIKSEWCGTDIGAQPPSNEHIDRMAGILLTYNFYDKDLGYVQGMSDLCAPLKLTFWCFVQVMDRMGQNFLRDQSGMKKQLLTLQDLISVMDPELYRHFEKADGLNLFFCFRWVLIAFKREFAFEDVLRLWEVLWTDYYSNNFVLFVALAVLESHRDPILRIFTRRYFDEILESECQFPGVYCNELSMTIELDSTLAQAEVLFLSYAQLVADIDRRRAEDESRFSSSSNVRRRRSSTPNSSGAAPRANIVLPTLSENLRELLRAGR
ncbi:rab-GTPase-TBC domain-containing protein [Pisolithus croceorrhizus]|nr:rab-GTPase-TBC domain-containing protein [Pisolithus croceorrhizus]